MCICIAYQMTVELEDAAVAGCHHVFHADCIANYVEELAAAAEADDDDDDTTAAGAVRFLWFLLERSRICCDSQPTFG